MTGTDRKAAIAAYKERKVSAGVYAVRCAATGEAWVGSAPDLGTIQNRLWFQLRMKGCPHRGLQAAWDAHGAGSFTYDVLERIEEETLPYARRAILKARVLHWSGTLGAPVL